MSSGKATLLELRESYYLEDVYNMLEIISVDLHNKRLAAEYAKKKAKD